MCHRGSGTGVVIGTNGHSATRRHHGHSIRPQIGKISALPTVAKGTIGTR